MRVRPTFARGRFFGWRVIRYEGPGRLRPGDIVVRVNGQPIQRPREFMRVWKTLAQREQLTIRMVRDGNPVTLRFSIVDSAQ